MGWGGTTYITEDSLRTRFYRHQSKINTNTGTHATRRFNLQNHTLANCKCLAPERVHTDDTDKRQERESFWIRKMRTCFLLGLICSSSPNEVFLPVKQPLTYPLLLLSLGLSYPLELSQDMAFIGHQANTFVVLLEKLWRQTNLRRLTRCHH